MCRKNGALEKERERERARNIKMSIHRWANVNTRKCAYAEHPGVGRCARASCKVQRSSTTVSSATSLNQSIEESIEKHCSLYSCIRTNIVESFRSQTKMFSKKTFRARVYKVCGTNTFDFGKREKTMRSRKRTKMMIKKFESNSSSSCLYMATASRCDRRMAVVGIKDKLFINFNHTLAMNKLSPSSLLRDTFLNGVDRIRQAVVVGNILSQKQN